MPPWTAGELPPPPRFTRRNWLAMFGPGLVLGASAIGGGEWLVGPLVTAKYGGALMWLATLSILGQALYNIEISRYTLYTGEPIFTGKFRTLPGPRFWLPVYLALDFGSLFPYLAANAAVPVEVLLLGGDLPQHDAVAAHWWMNKLIASGIFLAALIPLIVGGKIYNAIKALMSFKLIVVVGFLLILAVLYSRPATWAEIFGGFVKFGTVPVQRGEDDNGNGRLDPGEDWDGDGRLDVVERLSGEAALATNETIHRDQQGVPYVDVDGDGFRDGDNVENVFVALGTRGELPQVDWTFIALIAALAAIAGNGGLTNTATSNYTRDQGWGMGQQVGAIPSLLRGRGITLSHVGCVFRLTRQSLGRWRGWYRHVLRDQLAMWAPACFIGVGLPAMLSIEFLRRGTEADQWNAAVMTAEGVGRQVADPPAGVLARASGLADVLHGPAWGNVFWFMTLFCGFLVLGPSLIPTIDGILRRWVDVFWTASPRLRKLDPASIRYVYFAAVVGYACFGLIMLWLNKPTVLVKIATIGYNFALGFSCWHTLAINTWLLPRPLRPNLAIRAGLVLAGAFFSLLGLVSALHELGAI